MSAGVSPILRALCLVRLVQMLDAATRYRDQMAGLGIRGADFGNAIAFEVAARAFKCAERAVSAVEEELVLHIAPRDFAQA